MKSGVLRLRLSLAFSFLLVLLIPGLSYTQEEQGEGKQPGESRRKLSETELKGLLGRLKKNLGSIKSLKSKFTQEKHLSIFVDVVKSEGVLMFISPDRVRFEINEPFHSVLIANRKSVAKYELIEGKWQKLKLGNREIILAVTGQIARWLRGDFDEKDGLYKIGATVGENTTIVLTPKDEKLQKHIGSIELGVARDEKSIVFVVIREKGKDFTRITFSEEEVNVELQERYFDTERKAPAPLEEIDKEAQNEPGESGGGAQKK